MWYADILLSKGLVAAALALLICLYVRPGSLSGAKICTVLLAVSGLVAGLDGSLGAKRLQHPWNAYEVLYVAMAFAGSLLRLWAMATLDRHFTFEVGIVKDHTLVQSGPYAIIRHPGYTGGILGFFGTFTFLGLQPFSLAWWLLLAIPLTIFMVLRIRNEEETLQEHFGKEWEQHCKRTWRLFPPIF